MAAMMEPLSRLFSLKWILRLAAFAALPVFAFAGSYAQATGGTQAAPAGSGTQTAPAANVPAQSGTQQGTRRARPTDAEAALPDRAAMLRGAYGPYRANNDLLYYHLTVRADP